MIGICIWAAPNLITWMMKSEPEATYTTWTGNTVTGKEVDAFVTGTLPRIGATDLLARQQSENGAERAIYRLPRGADPADAARRLRMMGDEQGIEVYHTQVDGLNAEVRVYAGRDLRHQLLFMPDLPPPPELRTSVSVFDRPHVAIIVSNLGQRDVSRVIETKAPLSLAVRPFSPFGLRIAQDSVQSWHEVLVHLRTRAERRSDPREAIGSIPHASGVVVDDSPNVTLPNLPFGVVVHPADRRSNSTTELLMLPAQRTGRVTALEALNRTLHLAVRNGFAALVVDGEDRDLESVLDWAESAEEQGYRLVLASEAVRSEQVRGHPWEGAAFK